jgi:hypothetical protein
MDVRRHFGITSFGINAFSGGEKLIASMTRTARLEPPGGAVRRPERRGDVHRRRRGGKGSRGTLVFARPEAKRSAVATENGTTVLAVGGTTGKAFEPAPEESAEAFAAYTAAIMRRQWRSS